MNIRQLSQGARLVRKLGDWSNNHLQTDSEREHEFHKYLAGLVLVLEEIEKEIPPAAHKIGVADIIADPTL